MSTTGTTISADHLQVYFEDGSMVFDDLGFQISSGEVVAVVGPSGCGKTTLLRSIAGLQLLASGSLRFDPPVQHRHGKLAYVFQNAALMPWRSAWQNVALPLELIDTPGRARKPERKALACHWLSTVGLASDDYDKRPDQLSGGMQMRVSVARALITDPAVLLLDEPFSALDDLLRIRLGQLLQRLWIQNPRTTVLVTHNIQEAVLISQRVLVMSRGKIVGEVPVEVPYPRSSAAIRDPKILSCVEQVTSLLEEADAP